MLNMTGKVKRCLKADDGHVIFESDWGQAEYQIVARIADMDKVIILLENGGDVHRYTYARMFNKAPEEVSDEPGSSDLGDGTQSERQWGKRSNHGFNYGLGAATFSLKAGIRQRLGKELIDRYHSVNPNIKGTFHKDIGYSLRQYGKIVNCCGRVRHVFFSRLTDSLLQTSYAQIPQSTVADKMNVVLRWLYDQSLDRPVELLNMVYDSLIFQIPKDADPEEVQSLLCEMQELMETPVPRHNKDAQGKCNFHNFTPAQATESYVIPTEFQYGSHWDYEMEEVEPAGEDGLTQLKEVFGEAH